MGEINFHRLARAALKTSVVTNDDLARLRAIEAAAWAVINLEGGAKRIPMDSPGDPEEWGPWQDLLALLQKSLFFSTTPARWHGSGSMLSVNYLENI